METRPSVPAKSASSVTSSVNDAVHDAGRFSEELVIRQLLSDLAQANREGDIDRILSFYAPNVTVFDMPPPFKISSSEDYKAVQERWFISQFEFPMTYEIQDPQVFVGGDIAFSFCTLHVAGAFRSEDGKVENWLRHTGCYKKFNGQWKIQHEHVSAPVGEDGKSLMDQDPVTDLH